MKAANPRSSSIGLGFGAALCALGVLVAAPAATGADTSRPTPSALDVEAARRIRGLIESPPLTSTMSSPLYSERHLPRQRGLRGDTTSDYLVLLESGRIAELAGLPVERCTTKIVAGDSGDLDGDGVAAHMEAQLACTLRAVAEPGTSEDSAPALASGELSVAVSETDRSDESWESGHEWARSLTYTIREPAPAEAFDPSDPSDPAGSAGSAESPDTEHGAGTRQVTATQQVSVTPTGEGTRFRVDVTEGQEDETRDANGVLVNEAAVAYELQLLVAPEPGRRGNAIDYSLDGAVTELSGTLRASGTDAKTGESFGYAFDVTSNDLQYQRRSSGGRRCFFWIPHTGEIVIRDSQDNRLVIAFDNENCKRTMTHQPAPADES